MQINKFYVPTNTDKQKSENTKKQARFLHDFWEYGPWRINYIKLKERLHCLDYNSKNNIFDKYITFVSNQDQFQYYHGKNIIHIIWYNSNGHKYSTYKEFPDIAPKWKEVVEQFISLIHLDDSISNLITNFEIKPAFYSTIQEERSSLPICMDYDVACLRNYNEGMDLHSNFTDYGELSPNRRTIVYSITTKIQNLPGESNYQKLKAQNLLQIEKFDAKKYFLMADQERCMLPELPDNILTDNTQGHWDLYWPEGKAAPEQWYDLMTLEQPLEARDPAKDIQKAAVSIDFGTSSTVVATRDRKGQISLLRVGVEKDEMRKNAESRHFENPTMLIFENLQGLKEAWQGIPLRPSLKWADIYCSHRAKADLQDHIHSAFTDIKTWARCESDSEPFVLTDGNGQELRISPAPIDAGTDNLVSATINPIELYACFLGLYLNNQLVDGGRIFTDYYMTFPVNFGRQTRDRILAGFRRGLLRSLPATLVYASGFDPANLTVKEHASEPAAYAAAVLPLLDQNRAIRPGKMKFEKSGKSRELEHFDFDFI